MRGLEPKIPNPSPDRSRRLELDCPESIASILSALAIPAGSQSSASRSSSLAAGESFYDGLEVGFTARFTGHRKPRFVRALILGSTGCGSSVNGVALKAESSPW
jgi:hypothetical protein